MKRATATLNSRRRESRSAERLQSGPNPFQWFSHAAWVLTLVLVIARVAMNELLRGDTIPVPGASPVPLAPGPAVSLVLDWLCCVPALLLLVRRTMDSSLRLRWAWSYLAMGGLAVWMLASAFWACDKFAAGINAAHAVAAMSLIWSTSQLVQSWLRLRLVAGVAFGLLLILLVQGFYYRLLDLPDLQREWSQHHAEMLQQQGTASDSTQASQLGKNIASGEVSGFNVSRNTYAAVLVLLMIIGGGVIAQRLRDRDAPGWAIPVGVGLAVGLFMLYAWVHSKTAYATPVLAAVALGVLWWKRAWIGAHATKLFWAGVVSFLLAVAAVVGHGLHHGTLFHVSLTFRWWYWVGAARVFLHHPWLGIGWANFGANYLAYRLPQAAEQPVDPHNVLVRAFVELGLIGGLLTVGWIARVAWETSAGATQATVSGEQPTGAKTAASSSAVRAIVGLSLAAFCANSIVSVDWSSSSAWIILELFKRAMFLLAFLIGLGVVAIQSWSRQQLDDRPAPFLLDALRVALALFFLHNLIDFSMFEIGPMFLAALLLGSALGMTLPPASLSAKLGRAGSLTVLISAGVIWVVAAFAGVMPVVEAEALARDADEQIRLAQSNGPAGPGALDAARLDHARHGLFSAFRLVPINADYAFRTAQAAAMVRGNDMVVRELLDAAHQADPLSVRYLRTRASFNLQSGDLPAAQADYLQCLRLDPNNLEIRLEYAHVLELQHQHAQAVDQYRTTLELDDKLAPDEIRRLSKDQVRQVEKWIEGQKK